MKDYIPIIKPVLLMIAVALFAIFSYSFGYSTAKVEYYEKGYQAGYTAGYQERNRLAEREVADAVAASTKTETKIIYQKVPYNGNDVQVTTPPPTVTVSVNGKKQEVVQHQETADLAVKTETAVKIRVPERRWVFGIGTDGHKAAYMVKAPLKGTVGIWAAGVGRDKIMGGVSFSF